MTPVEVAATLRAHNAWRRGGDGEMVRPAQIGAAIDEACTWLKVAEYARLLVLAESDRRAAKRAFRVLARAVNRLEARAKAVRS